MRLLFNKARLGFPEPEYHLQLNGDDEHQDLEHTREHIMAMPRRVCYKNDQFDLFLHLSQKTEMINNERVRDETAYAIAANQ